MHERRGPRRSIAVSALAGILASAAPILAQEVEGESGGADDAGWIHHTVQSGETISGIALRFGSSTEAVMLENGIEDASKLWVGRRLRIPVVGAADSSLEAEPTHRVERPGHDLETSALIDRCEAELRAARFEQALASAAEARQRIDAQPDTADASDRVRIEVASATAYVALGKMDEALESFENALVADPNLELDATLTSPKVLAVFRVARSNAARSH